MSGAREPLATTVPTPAPYQGPTRPGSGLLRLDGNEGSRPSANLVARLGSLDPERVRGYPDLEPLCAALAERHGVLPERLVVTAGADGALDRLCRLFLGRGSNLLAPGPTFQMLDRFAAASGASMRQVHWPLDDFPLSALLAALDAEIGAVAVVTPNNPTGQAAPTTAIAALARAAAPRPLVVDLAYAEYADADPSRQLLEIDNVVLVRTLSKAWGLAGCRIGYAIARPEWAARLEALGNPYPVAAPAIELALARLESGAAEVDAHVERVRRERFELAQVLERCGVETAPSEANFLWLDLGVERAEALQRFLADRQIAVRRFAGRPELAGGLRLSLPGDERAFDRLLAALGEALPAVGVRL